MMVSKLVILDKETYQTYGGTIASRDEINDIFWRKYAKEWLADIAAYYSKELPSFFSPDIVAKNLKVCIDNDPATFYEWVTDMCDCGLINGRYKTIEVDFEI